MSLAARHLPKSTLPEAKVIPLLALALELWRKGMNTSAIATRASADLRARVQESDVYNLLSYHWDQGR